MSPWFVVVSLLVAVNPARASVALRGTPVSRRRRLLAAGAGVTVIVMGAVAVTSGAILDALEITDETWRIGAGIVALLAGARYLALRAPTTLPVVDAPVHAVAPVAFPLLLTPELLGLTVLYGATESVVLLITGAVVALGTTVASANSGAGVINRGAVRLAAAGLIVIGVALLVAGIRDV